MRRREFITGVGAVVAWPLAARAQQGDRARGVGFLTGVDQTDTEFQDRLDALVGGLRTRGWTANNNLRLEIRSYGGDGSRARALASELVKTHPDVIIAESSPSVAALLQETRTIPIVFTTVTDALGQGFVTSLAHPGGNVTGFTNYEPRIGGKWLEMLKEVRPGLRQVSLMFNPEATIYAPLLLQPVELAAPSLSLGLAVAHVHDDAEIESAIAALGGAPDQGLIVLPSSFMTVHRERIISSATRYRVPTVYPQRLFAVRGGLMSYGIDTTDLFRRAAGYIDRILKGEKPSDLPVQAPTRFELVLNLKTANELGIEISPNLLAQADEVIE